MPVLNWKEFENLPGAPEANFENVCRAIIRIRYGRYGSFATLASQPGVESHLKLHTSCALGEPGTWYGWQCRWYRVSSGEAIGSARRNKIRKAIKTTERVLPDLTDWVLWTRWPLTKGDQAWFGGLSSKMRLHQWTSHEVESHLGGDAEFLRNTYFGEWILTPDKLAVWHEASVAPIRRRWLPEVHQVVDAERRLRAALGEAGSWSSLAEVAQDLKRDSGQAIQDQEESAPWARKLVRDAVLAANRWATTLADALAGLSRGDLNILQDLFVPDLGCDRQVMGLPHRLRARRQAAALGVANVAADIRLSRRLLQELGLVLGKSLIAVVAGPGCGKTQLSAQLTARLPDRPAGVLLHGGNLNAGESLDSLAGRLSTSSGTQVPSMEALVAAVDAAGQRAGRRLPIVIDALNEAEDPRDWKALLASLQQTLRRYPNVLVVCTLRGAFAERALPDDVERVEIKDFGQDVEEAMIGYFRHYKIAIGDAGLPAGLLKHPLTLRLLCEVTNPNRERTVGIEVAPDSLSALFDRYLEQATARIIELAPRVRQFQKGEVARALDEVGIALWTERASTLDVDTLRRTLGEAGRPWTESIVGALENEGVILRYPAEPPGAHRLGAAYDLLGGHLAANAVLARHDAAAMGAWAKEPPTISSFGGPEWHPLAQDIFQALAGLAPRRIGQQLWPMFEAPLRQKALRAAADLEGQYLDEETVGGLAELVAEGSTGTREILDRLWNTRGIPSHPLNARFLDRALRSMSMPDRDLRWTEWLRRESRAVLADLRWLEKQWRWNTTEASEPDALRARWVMWTLTSTVRELRDQATRSLYWFGRRDAAALFDLTTNSLAVNDPYVPERMLAASYGVAMALQNGKGADAFRDERLPRFAKKIFDLMFAEGAPFATTHSLRRGYAKCIIEVASRWRPSLLIGSERARVMPPFKGGIRNWRRRPDYDAAKYRNGNNPLGFDWENYTMGRLARRRATYDFEHPDFLRVKEEVLWRIHDLGYSLARFGEMDAEISMSRYARWSELPKPERNGKKYSWIAFYELWGSRSDAGLLEEGARGRFEPHSDEIDVDPSFPDQPDSVNLLEIDVLGRRYPDPVRWVSRGPIPNLRDWLVCSGGRFRKARWVLAHAGVYADSREVARTGYVRVRAYFVAEADLPKLRRFLESGGAGLGDDHDAQELTGVFAGEFPWLRGIPGARAESVRLPVGRRRVRIPQFSLMTLLPNGGEFRTVARRQAAWRYDTLYESVEIVPLAQRSVFNGRSALERPAGLVPSRQVAEFAGMWLGLPKWSMMDVQGRPASIALSSPGTLNSESSLLVRKDIVDAYMRKTRSRMMWVVSGERQRRSGSGRSAAYRQYFQVFLLGRGGIERLYEVRDLRSG